LDTWQPQRTWVVVVGLLEWLHGDSFSSFPTANRRDAALVEAFRERGVPDRQILYVANDMATMKGILSGIPDHIARAAAGDMLILYYCGHGSRSEDGSTYFVSYEADGVEVQGWSMRSVIGMVDRHFGGSRALLLADCCYSGVLADEVEKEKGTIAYASLASSLASELSTGNWTFTEQVIAALRGHAIADGDSSGSITLHELGRRIVQTMAFAEDQIATFSIGPDFDADLVLAIARTRPDPSVGRLVEALSGGEWYRAQIVDTADGTSRVHYFGYSDAEDEWVTPDRLRDLVRKKHPVGSRVDVK
jgi:hypothetical protein